MAGLALFGLACGVDMPSILDRLMALERRSLTRITYRQSAVGGQQSARAGRARRRSEKQDRPRPRKDVAVVCLHRPAAPGQLVVMLYDGCLRFLDQAAAVLRDSSAEITATV